MIESMPVARSAGQVVAVARHAEHCFSKQTRESITLIARYGVEGDAHAGVTVKHRSRVKRDPEQPNLRQVHLIHAELFDYAAAWGYRVEPGELGENVTTTGVDLLGLSRGTRLQLRDEAVVEVTGLRNPCNQINGRWSGLMKELVYVDPAGKTVRLAGVMSIVIAGGEVRPGDTVRAVLPDGDHVPLEAV